MAIWDLEDCDSNHVRKLSELISNPNILILSSWKLNLSISIVSLVAVSSHVSSRDVCIPEIFWDVDSNVMSPNVITMWSINLGFIKPLLGCNIQEVDSSSI